MTLAVLILEDGSIFRGRSMVLSQRLLVKWHSTPR